MLRLTTQLLEFRLHIRSWEQLGAGWLSCWHRGPPCGGLRRLSVGGGRGDCPEPSPWRSRGQRAPRRRTEPL